jgi:membrane-bound inhibitor of C-type lysozyme
MKKLLSILMAASFALAMSPVSAQTTAPTEKQTAKKTTKKAPAKKAVDPDEVDADVAGSTVTEYDCAEGHKITVYRNAADPNNVALRWNKRIIRMKRVETESGAERLEHEKRGLVFIGIPAKAMLLDAKHGRQLANECKSAEQAAAGS